MLESNRRGLDAFNRGDFETAASHFRQALRFVPDDQIVRGNLNSAERELGQQRERARERAAEEQRRQRIEAENRAAIRESADRLATYFGTPQPSGESARTPGTGLDFMRGDSAAGTENPTGQARTGLQFMGAGSGTEAPRDAVASLSEAERGRRANAAQRMSKTLENANYNKAFDAIRARDYSAAIALFEKARAELGNGKLVNNGLALARDLANMRQRQQDASDATGSFQAGVQELFRGDYDAAVEHIHAAVRLAPDNARYRDELAFVQGVRTGFSLGAERERTAQQRLQREKAFKLAERAVTPMFLNKWDEVVEILEAAQYIDPTHETIIEVLKIAREARGKRTGTPK